MFCKHASKLKWLVINLFSAGSSYAFKYITRLVIKYMWVCFIQC